MCIILPNYVNINDHNLRIQFVANCYTQLIVDKLIHGKTLFSIQYIVNTFQNFIFKLANKKTFLATERIFILLFFITKSNSN